mmetsp:Transcript_6357/g.9852  ORF Transcript_6357/g.9852 Transcript_6357/m.9852 type:complete len:87 (+) Transcript_6357:27-287(+)
MVKRRNPLTEKVFGDNDYWGHQGYDLIPDESKKECEPLLKGIFDCIGKHNDWRKCQEETKKFRECIERAERVVKEIEKEKRERRQK